MGLQKEQKRLLIVDDEEIIREFITEVAEGIGYATMTAENGQEAVEKSGDADVILMDVDMPIKTGLEALAEIKGKYQDKFVLMMTGDLSPERQEKFKKLGAKDYMAKPIRMAQLQEFLRKYL